MERWLAGPSAAGGVLAREGADWVQVDEPALVTELAPDWQQAYRTAYEALQGAGSKLLLTTYFGRLADNLELAVTLGLGYPLGPLAMGDRYGPANILEVLFNMQTVYGDPRYRPSPWLRRRGALGLSLLHEEE